MFDFQCSNTVSVEFISQQRPNVDLVTTVQR